MIPYKYHVGKEQRSGISPEIVELNPKELMEVKCLSLFLIVSFLLSVGVIGTAGAKEDWDEGENRIRNSDFEADTVGGPPAEWNLEDGTCCDRGGEYRWEVDDSVAHTGNKSLKIIGVKASGTNWHAKVRHMDSSMEAGRKFTIAFWAKVDESEGKSRQVSTNLQMQHAPWDFYHGVDITLDSPDWKEYFDTFVASAGVVEDMWVGLAIAQSDVDFWIDDFRFFEGDPADEIVVEPEKFAVTPMDKLTSTWGGIKGNYRGKFRSRNE